MQVYDIVGCGAVARMLHAPALKLLVRQNKIRIGTCIDRDTEAARRMAHLLDAEAFDTSGNESIAKSTTAAVVTTHVDSHYDIAARYLRQGRHVLVEKPFVRTLEEAEELVNLSESQGLVLLVNHVRRLFPSAVTARRTISSGILGTIQAVTASEGHRQSWKSRDEVLQSSVLGGVVHDIGSHVFDCVLYILGLDNSQHCSAHIVLDNETSQLYRVVPHKARGYLEIRSEVNQWHTLRIDFVFSRQEVLANMIRIQGSNASVLVTPYCQERATLLLDDKSITLDDQSLSSYPISFEGVFELTHNDFYECILNTGRQSVLMARSSLNTSDCLEHFVKNCK